MPPTIIILRLFITGAIVTLYQVSPTSAVRDNRCWALFEKTEALAFLSTGKRSTPKECCEEMNCELRGSQCFTEQYRTYIKNTQGYTCPGGKVVALTSWCPGHYNYECTDICSALGIDRCKNGGTCMSAGDTWHCMCRLGFQGALCQEDVDECASSPCQNGGICRDLIGSYSCSCALGYTGHHCEVDIDECASSPCQNGGTCTNLVGKYSCSCPPGYTGGRCEQILRRCSSNSCARHTITCTNRGDDYQCICAAGYTGKTCATEIDECVSSPCWNGGTCIDLVRGYTYSCPPGYTGDHCEQDIDECASSPCHNGGTCMDRVAGYFCSCTPAYRGYRCELGLTCMACDDMTHVGLCDLVKRCNSGELCYLDKYAVSGGVTRFRSGCIQRSACPPTATGTDTAVQDGCRRCCSSDYCNSKGCGDAGLPGIGIRGPLCYSCGYVASVDECTILEICRPGQSCLISKYGWGDVFIHYQLGCGTEQMCTGSSSHVTRSAPVCHACCTTDYCNSNCTNTVQPGVPAVGYCLGSSSKV